MEEERIKLTINKVLFKDDTKTHVLTSIPGYKGAYIWINKNETYRDEDTLVALIDPNRRYDFVNEIGDKVVDNQLGYELYENYYDYEAKFDPKNKKAAQIQKDNKRILEQAKKKEQEQKGTDKQSTENKSQKKNNQQATANQQREEQQQKQQYEFTKMQYTNEQFKQLRAAMRAKLDVAKLSNINLSAEQMKEIRLGLKDGINVDVYNKPIIDAAHMREVRLGLKKGLKIDMFPHQNLNAAQTKEIRIGLEKNLNVMMYADPHFDADQMKTIRTGMQAGLDVTKYNNTFFNVEQMQKIKIDLMIDKVIERIKEMFTNIRKALIQAKDLSIEKLMNKMNLENPNTFNKEASRTEINEEIINQKISKVAEDIKDLLIKAELLPEEAATNNQVDQVLNESIKSKFEDIVNYSEVKTESEINNELKDMVTESISKVTSIAPKLSAEQQQRMEAALETMQPEIEIEEEFEMNMELEVG